MSTYSSRDAFLEHGIVPAAPDESDAICPICHEAYVNASHSDHITDSLPKAHEESRQDDENVDHAASRILTCGHIYGSDCIRTWLETADTCPMCRKKLFIRPRSRPSDEAFDGSAVLGMIDPTLILTILARTRQDILEELQELQNHQDEGRNRFLAFMDTRERLADEIHQNRTAARSHVQGQFTLSSSRTSTQPLRRYRHTFLVGPVFDVVDWQENELDEFETLEEYEEYESGGPNEDLASTVDSIMAHSGSDTGSDLYETYGDASALDDLSIDSCDGLDSIYSRVANAGSDYEDNDNGHLEGAGLDLDMLDLSLQRARWY